MRYQYGGIVTFNATRDTIPPFPEASIIRGQAQVPIFILEMWVGLCAPRTGTSPRFNISKGLCRRASMRTGRPPYQPAVQPSRGFVRSADGKITPFALPRQIGNGTISIRINNAGEVAGSYTLRRAKLVFRLAGWLSGMEVVDGSSIEKTYPTRCVVVRGAGGPIVLDCSKVNRVGEADGRATPGRR
jgi:hypothetical protein